MGKEPVERCAWKRPLGLTLGLRLAYSIFAACAALIQPVNWRLIYSNALTENLLSPDRSLRYLILGVWERFDTLWYVHIAVFGYDRPEAVVFFPLYPGLIKLLRPATGPMVAALLISTLSAFFLFWGLQELLRGDEMQNVVDQSVMLCAVWPGSFIFFAGYAESLLLALIVWSLCMARRESWAASVALGLAAGLTKAVGVVVLVPLLMMAFRRRKEIMLLVLLVPFGWTGYLGYLRWAGHEAIGSIYQQYWHTSIAAPWTTAWRGLFTLLHTPNPILILNLVLLVSMCVLAALSRARIEYLVYAACAIGSMLCKETIPPLQSISRYVLIIFPAFVGAARKLQGPRLRLRFCVLCASLFIMNLGLLWLFVGWSLVS